MAYDRRTHIGTVADIKDPERRGRIRVTCPGLFGSDQETGPWVEPSFSWGWFTVPKVGQQVTVSYVMSSDDDESPFQSAITSLDMRWAGDVVYTDRDPPPPEFRENYGNIRGFKTPRGHVLLFDDTTGSEKVSIAWEGGTKAIPLQASITMDDQGVAIVDGSGNAVTLTPSGVTVAAQASATVQAPSVKLESSALSWDDTTPGIGQTINMGEILKSLHPLTPQGAALLSTVTGAIPADGTMLVTQLQTKGAIPSA